MKRLVTKEAEFCDVCKRESYCSSCEHCARSYCWECRDRLCFVYTPAVHFSSMDMVVCKKPCDQILKAEPTPRYKAFMAVKQLRDELMAFEKDFEVRRKLAEVATGFSK